MEPPNCLCRMDSTLVDCLREDVFSALLNSFLVLCSAALFKCRSGLALLPRKLIKFGRLWVVKLGVVFTWVFSTCLEGTLLLGRFYAWKLAFRCSLITLEFSKRDESS